ncbi:ATP-binding protein [Ramlibacter sp. MMS24-I3-19]|uniref:ATP-binding protein n=1 Tax=Ramlibacter sp. MMS24-I3-19 TaxID=3416606 RepID=UPI003D054E0B
MEVIRAPQHVAFTMDDGTRVGEARRHAALLSPCAQLDEVQAGRVAIIVTELGNNLVRHATRGLLLLAVYEERREVEIVSIDRGPGIADVGRSLSDGFSTGGTPGTGLGAVRRLATDFHLHSAVPDGTIVVARVRAADAAPDRQERPIVAAGLSVALAGELVCGDAWAVAFDGNAASVLVADGLGHGPDAHEASRAAVDVFAADPRAAPRTMLGAMHARLRSTRGAAATLLQLDAAASTIRSSGAGNVAARIVSGDRDKTVLTQHGTVGLQMRSPDEQVLEWPPHALLAVHSDGLESRWTPQRLMPLLQRDPMLAAAVLLRDHSRGRDDATVVVARRAH